MANITLSEAKAIHTNSGNHFFDKDTFKFWGSKIESVLYANRCFVTSEDNFDTTARFYNVRQFSEDFTKIETVIDFNTLTNKNVAREMARTI